MNDITIRSSGALAVTPLNPFEQEADAANGNRIIGDLLRFAKGDWLAGRNGGELPRGTRLVANVAELRKGWQCWKGGRPVETIMGRVADLFVPPTRSSLGDTDQSEWELDNDGKPRDPWQATQVLILKAERGDQLYTFSATSQGQMSAIAKLCGEYGKRMRAHPNDLPIVALEVDSYQHSIKERGRIKVPVFKVCGWVANEAFRDALAADQAAAEDDAIPFEPAPAAVVKTATGRNAQQASRSAEF